MNNNQLKNWEEKVLNNYLDGTQLKEIPASRKKRLVVLRWLVKKFEEKVTYTERQVNEIISQHHSDYATLRREMIGYQLDISDNYQSLYVTSS